MLKIRNTLYIILFYSISVCAASCNEGDNEEGVTPEPDENETSGLTYIFERREAGYDLFRIPAIIKGQDGALIAFAEARKESSNGDSGDIDLVLKRSTDNGETWSEMVMVWDDGENTCGNPVPVVDGQTGDIHLLMTWNNGADTYSEIHNGTSVDTRRVFVTKSTDDGLTWEAPREITSDVKLPDWKWYGTGPVHGIQITEGAYKNRLVIPCYYSVVDNGTKKDYSHIIYSDDQGTTWVLGGSTQQNNVGESTVAELQGGKLLMNMRSSTATFRMITISEDGGASWSEVQSDPRLLDPKCQGSMLSHKQDTGVLLLFANAASSARENMTIKMSQDEGTTWIKKYNVHDGPSAYSDLVMVSDTEVGIAFEMGGTSPYGHIAFQRIPLADFK